MKRRIRTIFLVLSDFGILFLALFFSYLLRFEFHIPTVVDFSNRIIIIPMFLASLYLCKVYKTLWEYTSINELIRIVVSLFFPTIILLLINISNSTNFIPTSIVLMNYILSTVFISAFRLSYRLFRVAKSHDFVRNKSYDNVLIIGAGDAGVSLLKEIRNNKRLHYNVVGFLDDNENKHYRQLNGCKILGPVEIVKDIVEVENVSLIFITLPSASNKRVKEIINICSETPSQIRVLPQLHKLTSDVSTLSQAKEVKIEDLLGRDEVRLDMNNIKQHISGKTVLVTGGGGSIGSEIVRQLVEFNPEKIIILDIYENNAYALQMELSNRFMRDGLNSLESKPEIEVLIASVRDEKRIDKIFNEYRPHVVFHAAAHKHVPLMEKSPKEAIKNNVFGTYNVVRTAEKYNVERFVLISTDKAVNPTNIMGASKRYAEKIVQAYGQDSKTIFTCVRFGNVLGSNGSVIPHFKEQIKNGGPVTVTHKNIIRYFMTIPEASQLVVQSGCYAGGGEVFVLDMGEPVKIVDLAEKMIRLSGFTPYEDIDIVFTGLRPGEKMYEELLMDEEGLNKTDNNKIFIGKVENFLRDDIDSELIRIRDNFTMDSNFEFKQNFNNYVDTYKITT